MESYLGTTPFELIRIGNNNIETIAYPLEGETLAFISASGITSEVEIGAVNYLVYRLKEENLWDEFYNLYPFVGSTSLSNSINLINTTQYQITWTNDYDWTFDSNGVTGNGVDTRGNTFFLPGSGAIPYNPPTQTFNLSNSMHLYNRTTGVNDNGDFGGDEFGGDSNILTIKNSSNQTSYGFTVSSISWAASALLATNEELGFFSGNIYNDVPTSKGIFRNGIQIGQNTGTTPTGTIGVVALREIGKPRTGETSTNRNYALAAIGKGFADVSKLQVFYNIVQTYQTILGRAV